MYVHFGIIKTKIWMNLWRCYYITANELHEMEIKLTDARITNEHYVAATAPVGHIAQAVLRITRNIELHMAQC